MKSSVRRAACALLLLLACDPQTQAGQNTGRKYLGMFPAQGFRTVHGQCPDCATPPQALWYFTEDWVAVPGNGREIAGFSPSDSPANDVRHWVASFRPGEDTLPMPSLVWTGSTATLEHVVVEGGAIKGKDGPLVALRVTARIPTNRSFFDAGSAAFFAGRALRLHGFSDDGRFTARTIWPEDFRFDLAKLDLAPLAGGASFNDLITAEDGGARSPFSARLLWRRNSASPRDWAGRAVLGILLNGAQGDDDEAHAGHFAVLTGLMEEDGQWGDWLVSNFYNLDSVSEKGILAAMVPADNYMADLNSGQAWYRPSSMLVMILARDRAAQIFQGAAERVFNRYYRHDFSFDHARANCTGISVDVLRWVGWNFPRVGPSGRIEAVPAFFYKWYQDRSFASGLQSYNYLIEELTRLLPRAAFNSAAEDVLRLVGGGSSRQLSSYERMLRDDIDAVLFARIPQFPSSRAWGTYPVASLDEYSARIPADRSKMKIIPVAARPFPASLRDPKAFQERAGIPVPVPILLTFAVALFTVFLLVRGVIHCLSGSSGRGSGSGSR